MTLGKKRSGEPDDSSRKRPKILELLDDEEDDDDDALDPDEDDDEEQGIPNEADLKELEAAFNDAHQSGDVLAEMQCAEHLATVHHHIANNYAEARKWYGVLADLSKSRDRPTSSLANRAMAATMYLFEGNEAAMAKEITSVLAVAAANNDLVAQYTLYVTVARAFHDKGLPDKSAQWAKRAFSIDLPHPEPRAETEKPARTSTGNEGDDDGEGGDDDDGEFDESDPALIDPLTAYLICSEALQSAGKFDECFEMLTKQAIPRADTPHPNLSPFSVLTVYSEAADVALALLEQNDSNNSKYLEEFGKLCHRRVELADEMVDSTKKPEHSHGEEDDCCDDEEANERETLEQEQLAALEALLEYHNRAGSSESKEAKAIHARAVAMRERGVTLGEEDDDDEEDEEDDDGEDEFDVGDDDE